MKTVDENYIKLVLNNNSRMSINNNHILIKFLYECNADHIKTKFKFKLKKRNEDNLALKLKTLLYM